MNLRCLLAEKNIIQKTSFSTFREKKHQLRRRVCGMQ
jgi:hypothetical protein